MDSKVSQWQSFESTRPVAIAMNNFTLSIHLAYQYRTRQGKEAEAGTRVAKYCSGRGYKSTRPVAMAINQFYTQHTGPDRATRPRQVSGAPSLTGLTHQAAVPFSRIQTVALVAVTLIQLTPDL